MPHKCPIAAAEYKRQQKRKWYQENKELSITRSSQRTKRITDDRKELLSQFSCLCCGNPDSDVIQWHHVDPSTKEMTIWRGGYSEERFWDEVLKCIPVCANCHLKLHKEKLCLLPVHR